MIDPKALPPQLSNIQNSLYAAIENSKKQQWTITNYVILVYAAIFGLGFKGPRIFSGAVETAIFASLIFVAGVYGIFLLILIQEDLERYRTQLHAFYTYAISPGDRERYQVGKPYPYSHFWRGGTFLSGLIGVIVIGGVLVAYSLPNLCEVPSLLARHP
jgi:hypothetical protein